MAESIDIPALLARFDINGLADDERLLRDALAETWAELQEARIRIDGLSFALDEHVAEARTLEMRLMASRSARKSAEGAAADMRRQVAGARAAADAAIEAHVKAAQVIAEHEPRLAAARTAREQAEAALRAAKEPPAVMAQAEALLRSHHALDVFFRDGEVHLSCLRPDDTWSQSEGPTLAEAFENLGGSDG